MRKRLGVWVGLMVCLAAGLVSAVPMETILNPQSGETPYMLGASVAVEGDWMLAGAPYSNGGGMVEVYRRDSVSGEWEWVADLTAGEDQVGYFGLSVALSGDTALVGTYERGAYIFVRDAEGSWSKQAKLTAADGATGAYFGYRVALSGDTAVVGARGTSYVQGALYVFVQDGAGVWTQEARIDAPVTDHNTYFPSSIALDGDRLVVGDMWVDASGYSTSDGAAYIFERSATVWSGPTTLTASTAVPGGCFGASVDISGDTVLIGSLREMPEYTLAPRGSVFVRDAGGQWVWQANLDPVALVPPNWVFPDADVVVALHGDRAAVLVAGEDDGDDAMSSLTFFDRDGSGAWSESASPTYVSTYNDHLRGCVGLDLTDDAAVAGASPSDSFWVGGPPYLIAFEPDGSGGWVEQQRLEATRGATSARFGASIATAGDALLVAAPYDHCLTSYTGVVYVYGLNGSGSSALRMTLRAPAPDIYPGFGQAVAVSTDTLAVGAGYSDESVLVYTNDGSGNWTFAQELPAPVGAGNYFGKYLAADAGTLVVGLPNAVSTTGTVAVYTRDGSGVWRLHQELPNPGNGRSRSFGWALLIRDDALFVGSPNDSVYGDNAGAVHVYERNESGAWGYEATLTAPNPETYDRFGLSLAAVGDRLFVGQMRSSLTSNTGVVQVFAQGAGGEWAHEQTLTPSRDQDGARFGESLAASGSSAIVLAPGGDSSYTEYADPWAYLFNYTAALGWHEKSAFPLPAGVDWYGSAPPAVVVDGETLVVGGLGDDTQATDAGAVYLFDLAVVANTCFETVQSVEVSSDGSFYAMVVNFGLNQVTSDMNGTDSAVLEFEPTIDDWLGLYLYDYASGQWAEAMYVLRNRMN